MRNLVEYPLTPAETIEIVCRIGGEITKEGGYGDMRPMALMAAGDCVMIMGELQRALRDVLDAFTSHDVTEAAKVARPAIEALQRAAAVFALDGVPDIFTLEEVERLHQYQFGPWGLPFDPVRARMHPFTCANRDDGKHFVNGEDLGILIPTRRGWICQCCDYTQNWAHGFMKAPPPLTDEQLDTLRETTMRNILGTKWTPAELEQFDDAELERLTVTELPDMNSVLIANEWHRRHTEARHTIDLLRSSPAAVHLNMLHGGIARISRAQFEHIIGNSEETDG